jgi:hypothetical protein
MKTGNSFTARFSPLARGPGWERRWFKNSSQTVTARREFSFARRRVDSRIPPPSDEAFMGSFCIVVNTNLREWLDPEDFDVSPKKPWYASVDEHGANPLFHAIAYLCAGRGNPSEPDFMFGRWQGCEVLYPDDQSRAINGMDYGVVIKPREHGNLYNLARETFRNISTDLLREIAVDEPLLLISMFRKALSHCEAHSWSVRGSTILALYDEATDQGEWMRDHLERAANFELGWTQHGWASLIARLRECHARAEAEWPALHRGHPKEA